MAPRTAALSSTMRIQGVRAEVTVENYYGFFHKAIRISVFSNCVFRTTESPE